MKSKEMRGLFCGMVLLAVALVFSSFVPVTFAASNYPSKPITLVIPYGLGSGDTEARIFGTVLEKYLGQPIVASNITGGSGSVGLQHVLRAKPDGYTIGFMSSSIAFGIARGNIKVKPENINVIGSYNADWMGVFVPSHSPFKTFEEMVAYAKKNPGKLLIGGTNVASAHHSFLVTLCKDAEIDMQYVPYGGASDTTLALLGKNLDGAVLSPNSIRQYMETDGVRLLVYSTKNRVEEFENIPTGYELGYKHLDDMLQFRAYYTTPGVPEDILKILDAAFEKAAQDPEYQKYLQTNDLLSFYKNRQEFAPYFAEFITIARDSFANMGQ